MGDEAHVVVVRQPAAEPVGRSAVEVADDRRELMAASVRRLIQR